MGLWDLLFGKKKPKAAQSRELGGDERLLAHLATDKPLYRPGETLYARAALLDPFTHAPTDATVPVEFQVRGPKGETVNSGTVDGQKFAAFSFTLPDDAAGGEYRLRAQFPLHGFPPSEITFDVRAYRVPRLRTELEFVRKAYGPGDTVVATLTATRAEGGLPAGAMVTAVATVDGSEVHRGELTLDPAGGCTASFRLPDEIAEGEGTLALVIRDGGVQETAAKTIPIVLTRVKMELFPEGGDLVLGLPSRLYIEARTPKGKPADVAGRIIDGRGEALATFRTEHEGRGRVQLTPARAGNAYTVALDEPAGIGELHSLPEIVKKGFTIAAVTDGGIAGEPVRLRVASTESTKARVALSVREREVASLKVELEARVPKEVTLTPPSTATGVLRATIHDADDLPRAERLIFQRPERALRVEVEVSPSQGSPRDEVEVTVRTTDGGDGKRPCAALVTLSAVDDALLETVERRERAPRLPTQVLLGGEVRELHDCAVYLDEPAKLDLLLGTQGWRRFAFYQVDEFAKEHGERAERALARRRPPPPPPPAMMRGRAVMAFAAAAPGGPVMQADFPDAMALGGPLEEGVVYSPQDDLDFDAGEPAPPAMAMEPVAAMEIAAPPPPAVIARPDRDAAMFMPPPAPPFPRPPARMVAVREYAHRAAKGEGRTDFAETLYWNAALQTGDDGRARVTFDLADSVTTFRVRADAVADDGALGEGDATVEARRPFYLEPKLPLEVTAGDRIEVPLSVVNGTTRAADVALGLLLEGPLEAVDPPSRIEVPGETSRRVLLPITVGPGRGPAEVRVMSLAGRHRDDVTRALAVAPSGFPIALSVGGRLDGSAEHAFTIPADLVPASLTTEGALYPSPLASLADAVEALLREPCGCFEQTSSSNYPNVMVMRYLSSHQGADPKIARRAAKLLDGGYKKLTSFECKERGYEWFGGDPGHEALTAYGVMQFADMAEVHAVDEKMVERTRAWLLSRRDGQGGFLRNPQALDSFGGAPPDITDAYITWALVQAKVPGLEKEIARVRERAAGTDDPYYLALAANILGDGKLLDRLAKKQDRDGSVRGAVTSITRSGGESLAVETTSLAVLAWLRSPAHFAPCEKAVRFILASCKAGRFGATQSTILALKAIIAWDLANASPKKAGVIHVDVDEKEVAAVPFGAEQQGPIVLPPLPLSPGKRRVALRMEGGGAMPYALTVRYHTPLPSSAPGCKADLAARLLKEEVAEGETIDLQVELANRTDEGLPMTVAIVGLPGGLEARADQLKELVKEGRIDAFETRGREVILYRRGLAPSEKSKIVLSLVAAIPGRYEGPASRAYLYYTDEDKVWTPPLRVRVSARA